MELTESQKTELQKFFRGHLIYSPVSGQNQLCMISCGRCLTCFSKPSKASYSSVKQAFSEKKALCNTTWNFLAAKLIPLFLHRYRHWERWSLPFCSSPSYPWTYLPKPRKKTQPSQIVVTLSLKEKTKHHSLQIPKFLYIFPLECITESNKTDSSTRNIIIKKTPNKPK